MSHCDAQDNDDATSRWLPGTGTGQPGQGP
jgi:hypothetical protein